MDTVLAMTTALTSLHGHRRILVYCTRTFESSTHSRTHIWEGEDPFHHREVVDFAFPELGKCCWWFKSQLNLVQKQPQDRQGFTKMTTTNASSSEP